MTYVYIPRKYVRCPSLLSCQCCLLLKTSIFNSNSLLSAKGFCCTQYYFFWTEIVSCLQSDWFCILTRQRVDTYIIREKRLEMFICLWPEFDCPEVTLYGWQDIKTQLLLVLLLPITLCWSKVVWLCSSPQLTWAHKPMAGIAQYLECQTHDQKIKGSSLG